MALQDVLAIFFRPCGHQFDVLLDGVLDIGLELNEIDLACSVFDLESTHRCFFSGRRRGLCWGVTRSN